MDGGYAKLTLTETTRNSSDAAQGGSISVTSDNFIVYSTAADQQRVRAVSYTHLTLPTKA